ncbi:MAG TPA: hypothetical protein VFN35_36460 [Ktedonobacteraceae bacterium]|nr:hypothetical protein [Ktedonobacteraceae bacterium]
MSLLTLIILIVSLILFAQSISSLALMLYAWESPKRMQESKAPTPYFTRTLLIYCTFACPS